MSLDKKMRYEISATEIARQEMAILAVLEWSRRYRQAHGEMPRYLIQTFGCQQNESDSEIIAGYLVEAGFAEASSMAEATVIIFNTCSVRENADNRLFGHLGMTKMLKQKNRDLIVAVCGCMATQDNQIAVFKQSYPYVDLIFGTEDLYHLPEMLEKRLLHQQKSVMVTKQNTVVEHQPVLRKRKDRALVSIMTGCNNFCSYCIVPYTRGRERSFGAQSILATLRELAASGYREVMLLGQNVNTYGLDLKKNGDTEAMTFASLLRQAAQIEGLERIRFMSSHPKDLSDELIEVIGACRAVEPHLHLAVQSGSDRILKAMNRHYTANEFIELVRRVKAARPGITITTDLIVGFPGETEADFAQTIDLMEQIRFDNAFTFIYSPRAGTPAALLAQETSEEVIKQRFQRMASLQAKHTWDSNATILNTMQEVLVESTSDTNAHNLSGHTPEMRAVNFSLSDAYDDVDRKDLIGKIAKVMITAQKAYSMVGELIEFKA